jgi:RNA polymerase sigma-70 factor (sigma-E family)
MEPGDDAARFHAEMGAIVEPVRVEGGLLAELYLAHATDAVRFAYLLTGDRSLAEDLVQDAFVKVAGRPLRLRDDGAFYGYLRKAIVNLARSAGRHRQVERRYLERTAGRREIAAHDPDAVEREAMRGALLLLPIRQRTAIVLRFYEDLSEAQIAEVLKCRPGTVKSLISRGVDALRDVVMLEG